MIIKSLIFFMIFSKFQVQFWIRIHNLEFRSWSGKRFGSLQIRIRIHNTGDLESWDFSMNTDLDPRILPKK
jgi:hypothetical protein